jgi:hypothetical protein
MLYEIQLPYFITPTLQKPKIQYNTIQYLSINTILNKMYHTTVRHNKSLGTISYSKELADVRLRRCKSRTSGKLCGHVYFTGTIVIRSA